MNIKAHSIPFILTTSDPYKSFVKSQGWRKQYENSAAAIKAVGELFESSGLPADFPILIAGLGNETLATLPNAVLPPAFSAEGVATAVSLLGVRGLLNENNEKSNGAGAVVLYPSYSIDAIGATAEGLSWLDKVVEKEMAHEAFRNIRGFEPETTAASLGLSAQEMPLELADFIESGGRDGVDMSFFKDIWAVVVKSMSMDAKFAALASAYPTMKAEIVKCIRSKSYAESEFPTLESMGKAGAFVFAANFMIRTMEGIIAGDAQGEADYETAIETVKGWLATRDTKALAPVKRGGVLTGEVDLNAFDAFLAS